MRWNDREFKVWCNTIPTLAERMGPEKYEAFLIKFIEKHEDMLREKFPDNPGLEYLDRWREEQKWKS